MQAAERCNSEPIAERLTARPGLSKLFSGARFLFGIHRFSMNTAAGPDNHSRFPGIVAAPGISCRKIGKIDFARN